MIRNSCLSIIFQYRINSFVYRNLNGIFPFSAKLRSSPRFIRSFLGVVLLRTLTFTLTYTSSWSSFISEHKNIYFNTYIPSNKHAIVFILLKVHPFSCNFLTVFLAQICASLNHQKKFRHEGVKENDEGLFLHWFVLNVHVIWCKHVLRKHSQLTSCGLSSLIACSTSL